MKKINSFSLAFTIAGCVLGAGYVSGQELWQFFGSFGDNGVVGLLLAFFIFGIFSYVILRVASVTREIDFDKLVVRKNIKFLRSFLGIAEVFFLFGIVVIMSAGAGALCNQLLGIPSFAGSAIFCAAIGLMALKGVDGMLGVFSFVVPVLTIIALVISVITLKSTGFDFVFPEYESENPLLSNFVISALTFVSYNLFCTVGILSPVAYRVKGKKGAMFGSALGAAILFVCAFFIVSALGAKNHVLSAELPMLALASELSYGFGMVYAGLLLGAMFGTALSSVVAIITYLHAKSAFCRKYPKSLILTQCVLACIGSLFGFGNMIGVVYPLCGYLGIIAIIGLAEHFLNIPKRSSDS